MNEKVKLLPSFNESKSEILRLFKSIPQDMRRLGSPILEAFSELDSGKRKFILMRLMEVDLKV